jgi:RNase P subunit RPR2
MAEINLYDIDPDKLITQIENKYQLKLPKTIKSIEVNEEGKALYIAFECLTCRTHHQIQHKKITLVFSETGELTGIKIPCDEEII